jgi:hypothetical protein
VPPAVQEALDRLRGSWCIGDEELEDAMALARVARQIALGFYYRWAWRDGVKDHEWLEARAGWHRAVRTLLQRSREGYDSPLLLARAAQRGDLNRDALNAWTAWDAVRARPEPPTVAVWLDEFAVAAAAEWLVEAPGIVWCEHTAFGVALSYRTNLPYHGGGTTEAVRNIRGDCSVLLSIKAHSEGHDNLSVFARNLVTSPPSSGKAWEQMLGRTHRQGQRAEEVTVDVWTHTDEMRSALEAARASAEYIQQTQGNQQKLCYGDWT